MRNIFIAALFFATQVFAADTVINTDKLKVGKKSSAAVKIVEFDINAGAANPKVQVNPSTSKLQFTNDGTVFKDIGSGSGGGSGISILAEPGFESGINVGWSNSGGTYAAITSGVNLLYQTTSASFQASSTGQYFESTAVTIPNILYGQSCMAKITYKGGDANLFLTALDGSGVSIAGSVVATLSTQASPSNAKLYFTCPSSGSMKLRIQSTAASAVAFFDEAHLGAADFATSKQVQYIGEVRGLSSASYTIPAAAAADVTLTSGAFTRAYSGVLTAPTANRVGFIIPYMPKGRYVFKGSGISVGSASSTTNSQPVIYFKSNDFSNCGVLNAPGNTTSASSEGVAVADFSCDYEATTDLVNKEVYLVAASNTGGNLQTVGFNIRGSSVITATYYPSGSDTVVNSKCPNDIACENNFSLAVATNAVISNLNANWVTSCTNPGAGQYVCNFASGIFTIAPLCTITSAYNGTLSVPVIQSITSSSITWFNFNSGGGGTNSAGFLTCQKAAGDYKAKQNIQGFLTSMLTSSLSNLRLEYVSVTTQCTASPCTIASQSGSISSVTRSGVGSYIANFTAGTFSSAPFCWGNSASNLVAQTMSMIQGSNTPTTSNFVTVTSATGSTGDGYFNMFCLGAR